MKFPLRKAGNERLRVLGFISGSGKTLFETFSLQKKMEENGEFCPFEVVGVFASKSDSLGVATATSLNIPVVTLDIKEFYKSFETKITDMIVRERFDEEVLKLIEPFKADIILLAGYVWATTDKILNSYPLINVHPGDLSVVKEGVRIFAGKDGVGDTLKAMTTSISSTSHIATKVIDGGPILMLSEPVEIDYNLHSDDFERFRYYLKLINEQGRRLGARTILEIANGNFSFQGNETIKYKNKQITAGVRIVSWKTNQLEY